VEKLLLGCTAVGIQVILALSVNMISGYARQLSLGQAGFAAIGAYTSALLGLRFGWSFWITCPLSILMSGGVGLLLGFPVVRIRKYYVLVMTLSVSFLVQHVLRNGRFTGGYFGLGQIAPPRLPGTTLEAGAFLPLVVVAIVVCLGVDRWFRYSCFGRALHRQTDGQGGAVLAALVLSTMRAGLAGSLFAHFEAFISPFDFGLEVSLFALAQAAWGGFGSPAGAALGAVFLGGLFEAAGPLMAYRLLSCGVVFLVVGRWLPGGVWALCRRLGSLPTGHAESMHS
jgi:branched-chain amino acid transport system permease protein